MVLDFIRKICEATIFFCRLRTIERTKSLAKQNRPRIRDIALRRIFNVRYLIEFTRLLNLIVRVQSVLHLTRTNTDLRPS